MLSRLLAIFLDPPAAKEGDYVGQITRWAAMPSEIKPLALPAVNPLKASVVKERRPKKANTAATVRRFGG